MTFYTLHIFLVLSLLYWSLPLESSKALLESISNETQGTTVGVASCPIGNETCASASETTTTEVSAANLTNASDPSMTATTPVSSTTSSTTTTPGPTTATPSPAAPSPAAPSPAPPSSAKDVPNKVDPETDLMEGSACTCDLTAEECESNCCCDPDCQLYQIAVFSSCLPRPRPLFDDRMCHTMKTVVVNKTERLVEETRPGALCIVKKNIAAWVVHPTRPAILTQSKFHRAWSRTRASTWLHAEERPQSPVNLKPYAQDSFLLRFHPQRVQFVDLPSPSATSICSTKRPIRFLRSWNKSCIQQTPENRAECHRQGAEFFLQKMNIIADPASVNTTKLVVEKTVSCPEKLCAPVIVFNCSTQAITDGNFSSCRNVSNKALSFFNETTNICHGVVKDLRLVISHNGTEGVHSISAYFSVTNTSVLRTKANILQRSFSVDFQWLGEKLSKVVSNGTTRNARTLSADDVKRSGHPGYISGKAVRSGHRHKVQYLTKSNPDTGAKPADKPLLQEKIYLSQQDWLSVFSPGACELRRRHSVLFGEDIHVSCGLILSESNFSSPQNCNELRLDVLRHLLGPFNSQKLLSASSLDTWGIVIGTFGDSNPNELSDWIPLIVDGLSMTPAELTRFENRSSPEDALPETFKCEGISTTMEIRFLHSFVGSINNPQSKIIGASVRFEPAQDLLWQCDSATLFKGCIRPLHLTTSVKFVDVSSPAVAKFAEPPGIHVRLPPDFFYPFMVAGNNNSSASITPHTALLVFIIINCVKVKLAGYR